MEQVDQKELSQQLHDKASKISIRVRYQAHDKHYALLSWTFAQSCRSLFYPMIKTVSVELFLTNSLGKPTVFVGLQNYIDLLRQVPLSQQHESHVHLRFVRVDFDDCLGIASGTSRKRQTEGHRLSEPPFLPRYGRVVSVAAIFWLFICNPSVGLLNKIAGISSSARWSAG